MRNLTPLTMVSCIIGLAVGLICQACGAPSAAAKIVGFFGQLWLRALKLMVVPMIFTAILHSVATATRDTTDRSTSTMVSLAVGLYLTTTVIAACEGVLLFNIFAFSFAPLSPELHEAAAVNGTGIADHVRDPNSNITALDSLIHFGFELVPDNLAELFVQSQLLGLISVAAFIGSSVHASPKGQQVVDLALALNETFVAMIKRVILLTPLGVGSLVAGSIAAAEDPGLLFRSLSSLVGVVFTGQALHTFGLYPAIYYLVRRQNPYTYFRALPRVWACAFGTSSSAATLSTTMEACKGQGVSDEVLRFVLPIGTTVNMDGGALERPCVVLWIAHVSGISVDAGRQALVAITSILLSVGASPIPSAGVSTLVLMVEQAGVPFTPGVLLATSICLSVEWLFDRVRTCVNVTGDAVVVAVVDAMLQQRRQRAARSPPVAAPEGSMDTAILRHGAAKDRAVLMGSSAECASSSLSEGAGGRETVEVEAIERL